jgi:MATE family multidrug resistance protein
MLAGTVINAGLDLALIFGLPALHVPALGVIGAALATTCVQAATVVLYALAVRTLDRGQPRPRSTTADFAAIVKYGGPVAGQLFAEVGLFTILTVLAGRLGRVPAAAHSVALNLCSFTYSAAVGIASATCVRVGRAAGAADLALARKRGVHGMAAGLAAMASCAAIFVAVPHAIASLFSRDPSVVAATIPLLQIAAVFQLSDGAQAIAAGALRGLGNTHATLVGNLLGHYLVGLPISLALAFGASLGAPGLWWGLSGGLTATALYLVVRFLAGTRARAITQNAEP